MIFFIKIGRRISQLIFNFIYKREMISIKPPIIIGYWPYIENSGKLLLGENIVFRSYRLRHNITVAKGATLDIGPDAFINDGVVICASLHIKIGHSVKIGDMVYIYDTDFHAVSPDSCVKQKSVTIGDNVWIGAKSMILAGAVIGDHSVIAAGSIVTSEIPPKTVAAGSPARVIKSFATSDDWVRGLDLAYGDDDISVRMAEVSFRNKPSVYILLYVYKLNIHFVCDLIFKMTLLADDYRHSVELHK